MEFRRPGVFLVVAALLVVVSACANRPDQAGSPASAAPATALTTASTQSAGTSTQSAGTSNPVRDNQSPAHPRTGPAQADVGAVHPFDLLAHCGVTYTTFAGRTWKVEQPVADPPGEPLARGSVNYLPGAMRLVTADELRFTVDAGSQVVPGAVITFRPTTETPPLCR